EVRADPPRGIVVVLDPTGSLVGSEGRVGVGAVLEYSVADESARVVAPPPTSDDCEFTSVLIGADFVISCQNQSDLYLATSAGERVRGVGAHELPDEHAWRRSASDLAPGEVTWQSRSEARW